MLWLAQSNEDRDPKMISDLKQTHFLVQRKRSVRSTMLHVMAALLPGTVLYMLVLDFRILLNLVAAFAAATLCEYICLRLRAKPVRANLSDGSTLLGVWLLVLCLPPSLPLWQVAIGAVVLVTLGKHVFGGLGHNPFNPAMVAYAFLLVSFPVTMTTWDLNQPDFNLFSTAADTTVVENPATTAALPKLGINWDGVTGATALDRLRALERNPTTAAISLPTNVVGDNQQVNAEPSSSERSKLANTWIMNSHWTWLSLAWLLGGLYLLRVKIISWHTPASIVLTISGLYAIANLAGLGMALPIIPALLSGGIMLGAFFIATDPVSAAASRQGQLIYGFGIGILTVVIREFSVYPEGFAFAVLLMNMCVPVIDYISTGKHGAINSSSRVK